jgi:hypothetical protein
MLIRRLSSGGKSGRLRRLGLLIKRNKYKMDAKNLDVKVLKLPYQRGEVIGEKYHQTNNYGHWSNRRIINRINLNSQI